VPRPPAGASRVHAVLLAAGASRRFGGQNKLLVDIKGKPLVRRVAERVLASRAGGVVVVTGHEAGKVGEALERLALATAHNPDFADGLASSLRCGVAALPEEATGAMIVLADMPGLTTALIDRLIAAFEREKGEKIVYPARGKGGQGNPVIWPRRFFAALQALEGDRGAKALIAAHAAESHAVPGGNDELFRDIDTAGDLADWGEGGAA
jgi:molybdenum cofactor cytidylyltransferase